MKTAIHLVARDRRTGNVASAIITATINWHPIDFSCDMSDFRPMELNDIMFVAEDYTTRFIPPTPRPSILDRIRRWITGGIQPIESRSR